ncbi:MAG: hypothetical protein ACKO23_05560, partial [Gemmataceae bacterium]
LDISGVVSRSREIMRIPHLTGRMNNEDILIDLTRNLKSCKRNPFSLLLDYPDGTVATAGRSGGLDPPLPTVW